MSSDEYRVVTNNLKKKEESLIEEVRESFENWKPNYDNLKKSHHFLAFKAGYEKGIKDANGESSE